MARAARRWLAALLLVPLVLPLAVSGLQPVAPAVAHALKVFAAAVGQRIEGRVYFSGGGAARGASIVVETADGRRLAATTADADGRFTVAAHERVDHVIIADSGDGHVARITIAAASLPASLPVTAPAAAAIAAAPTADPQPAALEARTADAAALEDLVARGVAAQITPLREQLAALETRLRLQDILGGLGYIVGLAGLALWLKARLRVQQRGEG